MCRRVRAPHRRVKVTHRSAVQMQADGAGSLRRHESRGCDRDWARNSSPPHAAAGPSHREPGQFLRLPRDLVTALRSCALPRCPRSLRQLPNCRDHVLASIDQGARRSSTGKVFGPGRRKSGSGCSPSNCLDSAVAPGMHELARSDRASGVRGSTQSAGSDASASGGGLGDEVCEG